MSTYIKLYRKSLGSAVFDSEPLWRLWSYLLLSANWAERQLPDGTVLQPGQMVRGRRRIAEDLKWAPSKVQRWTERLESLGNITIGQRTGPLAKVITICNWETYQVADLPSGSATGSSSGSSSGSLKKKDKKGRNSERPTLEEIQAYCLERKNAVDPERFLDHYTANGWVQGRGKSVKDWRACVRSWEKNNFDSDRKTPEQQPLLDFDN